MPINTIHLNGYTAEVPAPGFLSLGTKESHGIEKIQVIPGPEWDGLVITATFVTPRSATRVVVPEDGVMDVPPEATALYLNTELPGIIVFAGTSDGVQRISTNAGYIVADHAPVEGDSSQPTPSEWEQFVSQVQGSAQQASQSAAQAAQSAQNAGAVLGQVQDAGSAAVQQVQDAGTSQVGAVNTAGDAKLQQIEEVNALLPTPTEADAGKAPIAQPDGTYVLGEVLADAYTKAESDARYAPIEAAIKVGGKGTVMVSLSPTVGWGMQGLTLYGRSWQDGTPSVENEVPIQSAGQDGQITVQLYKNLLKLTPAEYKNGITVDLKENLVVKYNNTSGVAKYTTITNAIADLMLPVGSTLYTTITIISGNPTGIGVALETQNEALFNSTIFNKTMSVTVSSSSLKRLLIWVEKEVNADCTFSISISGQAVSSPLEYVDPSSLLISTTDGLPGVPVDSGGGWTDENGKQWISDVVDFAARTKTQYCGQIASYNGEEITTPYISSTGELTIGAQVVYVLPEPVTTPLDASTIAAYQVLQSYPGTTNVLAPDCGIEAAAVGDATQIIADINRKLAAL